MSQDVRKVVVVTGGAKGIGRAIVEYFIARDWNAIMADRDAESATKVLATLPIHRAHFIAVDVRNEDSVRQLIEQTLQRFGRIDCLCNNAGIEIYRRADEYNTDEWNAIHETNLRGPFLCCKYASAALEKSQGSIVHISSVQAMANEAHISAYAATKAGLLGLTRSAALDFAPLGIRVNAICPGAVQTEMMDDFFKSQTNPEEAAQKLASSIPLGKIGQPEDVAKLVYFLASEDAHYITGASVVIDGGLLARLALTP